MHVCARCANEMNFSQFVSYVDKPPAIISTNPDPLLIKPSISYWELKKMVDIFQK